MENSVDKKMSVKALLACVLGATSIFVGITGPPALVLGLLAIRDTIHRDRYKGKALAIIGVFLGGAGSALLLLMFGVMMALSGSDVEPENLAISVARPDLVHEKAKEEKAFSKAELVDIAVLFMMYRENEVRADAAYKGKVIQTSGVVVDVKKDLLDSVYVTLGTGARREFSNVQCFVADSDVSTAAALSPGDNVDVRGRVDGLMMNVLMKECVFVGR